VEAVVSVLVRVYCSSRPLTSDTRRRFAAEQKAPVVARSGRKEVVMPRRSLSQHVPKDVQARFDAISQLTDGFAQSSLNDEYALLCRQLAATLARKRPSPLLQGKAPTWACGIIHALGMVNFLFDPSQTPHVPASQIWEHFGLSASTMQAKSKQIRDLLGMSPFDPDWTLPSLVEKNPLIWMLEIDGLIVDVRYAPRAIQEEAFLLGLIPYIPGT
jgi:hypothetical protein